MAGMNVVQKILSKHLVSGDMVPGKEIAIKIDQTLTQDATGTMAYLQFEAMDIPRVKTKLSVSYVDHNMLQSGYENADDHRFLQTVAAKYGIVFSRPGNGICHQLHLERFGVPGQTLIGSDSHTPTNGGIGMIAIGAGGLDVALAMGGAPFYITTPKVVNVKLTNKLKPWVSAKDVILEILRLLSVKGGVGKVMEYTGPGVKTLTVPERATITNMGAELGATTSVFPSDAITKKFLEAQGRGKDWVELKADSGAKYEETLEIDLAKVEPMAACPHSPDAVKTIKELAGMKVDQVAIGSCTNSSYLDLMRTAKILKGKTISENLALGICPGSRQVYQMLGKNGALQDILASGARILEAGCGPCIGMGFSPPTEGVCLRTFNRNFLGRSGTKSADVYLVSPEVAAISALKGEITDPRKISKTGVSVPMPKKFLLDDSMFIKPPKSGKEIKVSRGPNIAKLPLRGEMPKDLQGKVLISVGDNITTDHIMPAGAKILPLRSNIVRISEHVFEVVDTEFPQRCKDWGGGFIVGGSNYGQGSSREHAALAPMYLGVKAVITVSFARIHLANLINFGILPLTFVKASDYKKIAQGDELVIPKVTKDLKPGQNLFVENKTKKQKYEVEHPLTERQIEILLAGGALNYTKKNVK